MVIKKIYDEKTHTQKVWYDSTMIYYTEMVEDESENKGNLYVTFKNGTTYLYHNVRYEDYILFVAGGTDASQGKTLNKVIKNNYEYEKIGDADMEAIAKALIETEAEEEDITNTYFISGHRDITEEEFQANYEPTINYVLHANNNARFIVGDYYGADIMAQNYLMDALMIEPERLTVYHMLEAPRNINPKVVKTKGGFTSDDERDEAMTRNSSEDIAFVRDPSKISGTAKNILRRFLLKTF